MIYRQRRLRKNPIVREMVAETHLSKDMFIYPYFIVPGNQIKHALPSLPGIHHFSIDKLIEDVAIGLKLGVNKIMLFGVGEEKSADAHTAYDHHGLVPKAIRALREAFGEDLYIVTDVCVCSYTTHGHCGILEHDYVQNDATIDVLTKMSLAHAEAGADMLAPSDMMDGRISAIRKALDENNLVNVAIMSHATKFASSYYGPFREAADCAPSKGDRKAYQMDFRNPNEALREAFLDEQEGADVLMIKPALAYLDVISRIKDETTLPLACYNVSGEFAMVKAAAQNGWIDEQKIVMETMYAFARAGARIITTYHIRDMVEQQWI
ncbi:MULTISPECIES: porphobilinogen synthase [Olivibacter]|jgi:porphobilinogen synthase|uniref:Delta-aminolevulinic acid dehydratase n=1 Tax=Olivibacter jilunii TaxID=985016 RepID=A0ABW6B1G1_9SPHI|nr:porphobilinogen synthase [Olivibacter sp. 47]MCL4639588.1 porphobilinogen synthase [Olivibacter sp. UJ_SKK_5.1]MDM8173894.1 porphobilinogen synthase [Olivibacter sp. 47]MDX3915078.1 porphobilinogen synthase [Pseudosphingobacterium sp.]